MAPHALIAPAGAVAAAPVSRHDLALRILGHLNLALRFGLELLALYLLGDWGWIAFEGALHVGLAIASPLIAATLWGTFRIPGDPKPEPPVPVRGAIRLGIEALVLVTPVVLIAPYRPTLAMIDGALLAVHYLAGGRLRFLLRRW